MNPFDLSGTTAAVTGASRGIGLAIAEALASAGADIIGVSASIPASGSIAEKRVRGLGSDFRAIRADLSDPEDVSELARELAASDLDILVNNAGSILRAPASEHPDEYWNTMLQVNLSSQFLLAREVGRSMLARGRGRIIFMASLLSFQGGINVPGYAASKSGIAGLTRALANEWTGQGVTVNAIAPGYIATDNTRALRDDEDRSRSILERIPAERWGQASDIGGAAVFLASSAADYVSGIVLPVDGGWLGR